jgi:hypothetical protein
MFVFWHFVPLLTNTVRGGWQVGVKYLLVDDRPGEGYSRPLPEGTLCDLRVELAFSR